MENEQWLRGQLISMCHAEIERVIRHFENKYCRMIPRPAITFDKRGKCAGQANGRAIKLNRDLLFQEGENFVKRTPGHEAVHHVEACIFGTSNHGLRWQRMMVDAGLSPERTHKYDVSKVQVCAKKRHTYKCSCRTVELTSIRHNRVVAGTQSYRCLKCGDTLIAV